MKQKKGIQSVAVQPQCLHYKPTRTRRARYHREKAARNEKGEGVRLLGKVLFWIGATESSTATASAPQQKGKGSVHDQSGN